MQETRARVPDVEVPCFVFQSRQDEIVSEKSYDMLAENPKIQLHWLEHSDHKYHPPKDKAFLLQRFDALCQAIT
jgi:esterase/lipase